MTAEVVVLNRGAVALAADSKVTVGGGSHQKTYDTQNKIFTLSKIHPVGILVYNNADFMDYPWETVIKLYRSQKGNRVEPTIEAWAKDFTRFLKTFGALSSKQKFQNTYEVLTASLNEIVLVADKHASDLNISPTSKKYRDNLEGFFEGFSEILKNREQLFPTRQSKKLIKANTNSIARALAEVLPKGAENSLIRAGVAVADKMIISDFFSPLHTGFVIAGFGSREIFPTVVHCRTDGYLGPAVKLSPLEVNSVSSTMRSAVVAYAQADIVHRFMEGIDPNYSNYLEGAISTAMVETNLKIFERWAPRSKQTDKIKDAIRKTTINQFEKLQKRAVEYRRTQFWHPTVEMVSILPKDELAHLAESLVELTSLHRRVSRDLETVGGPIDVAVISKSDGFVWVKRKHYFKAELNPQFALNYLRDLSVRRQR